MFLKYKTKKAVKKIIGGASSSQIQSAVGDVFKEASRQLTRKLDKLESRLPVKVTITPR